jgi:hypothetical protein
VSVAPVDRTNTAALSFGSVAQNQRLPGASRTCACRALDLGEPLSLPLQLGEFRCFDGAGLCAFALGICAAIIDRRFVRQPRSAEPARRTGAGHRRARQRQAGRVEHFEEQ